MYFLDAHESPRIYYFGTCRKFGRTEISHKNFWVHGNFLCHPRIFWKYDGFKPGRTLAEPSCHCSGTTERERCLIRGIGRMGMRRARPAYFTLLVVYTVISPRSGQQCCIAFLSVRCAGFITAAMHFSMISQFVSLFVSNNQSHFLFVLFLISRVIVRADIFTSTAAMSKLLDGNMNVVVTVQEYIKAETKRLGNLESMAKTYERDSRQWMQGIDDKFLENPVAMYLIIKRLAKGWMEIEDVMRTTSAEDVLSLADDLLVPNETDVVGAATGLLRLQNTYRIETGILANGYLPGVPQFAAMSAKDCYDIGVVASNLYDDYHAVLWFQEAYNRLPYEQPNPSVKEEVILGYLAYTLGEQEHYAHAYMLSKRISQLRPGDEEAAETLSFYENRMIEFGQKHLIIGAAANWMNLPPINIERNASIHNDEKCDALCRGETAKEDEALFCYFKTDSPFLRLAALKVEVLNQVPKLLLFHSVISTEEAATIKKFSSATLARSQVMDVNGSSYSNYRISKNTWLEDEDHPLVAALTKRVGDMIGLDMQYAEFFQVANYGLGGYYERHHDCGLYYVNSQEREDELLRIRYAQSDTSGYDVDDRLATVIIYLNQPVSGGATVFPLLDVSVFPVAGTAIFWYNVRRNGSADPRLLHEGCPVLAGTKWIMNKWISTKNQEFRYSCKLNKDE